MSPKAISHSPSLLFSLPSKRAIPQPPRVVPSVQNLPISPSTKKSIGQECTERLQEAEERRKPVRQSTKGTSFEGISPDAYYYLTKKETLSVQKSEEKMKDETQRTFLEGISPQAYYYIRNQHKLPKASSKVMRELSKIAGQFS